MPIQTNQYERQEASSSPDYSGVTFGTVVDTNDPQNNGRIRVVCPKYGDTFQSAITDIPWALNGMGFAGATEVGTRGPGYDTSEGTIAHGLWTVPTVGTQVVIACVDGDPRFRVYLGCLHKPFAGHTLPHGRWFAEDHPAIDSPSPAPHGPLTSREKPIQPLHDNLIAAFGSEPSPERASRAADFTAARLDAAVLSQTVSSVPDDFKVVGEDGWVTTQGYQLSRRDPTAASVLTEQNFDNQVTSFTSPGFHSISMDDRQENCRVRIRTTSGHQILLDDTNERIYISTCRGENWVELDQTGHIDIYSGADVSIHAAKNLNLSAGGKLTLFGNEGVDIRSADLNVAADNISITGNELDIKVGNTRIEANDLNIKASGIGKFTANGMHLLGGPSITMTAGIIHENGPGASEASPANPKIASFPSRMPQHEPWPRMSTKGDSLDPIYDDPSDPRIGKVEGNNKLNRNPYWRR